MAMHRQSYKNQVFTFSTKELVTELERECDLRADLFPKWVAQAEEAGFKILNGKYYSPKAFEAHLTKRHFCFSLLHQLYVKGEKLKTVQFFTYKHPPTGDTEKFDYQYIDKELTYEIAMREKKYKHTSQYQKRIAILLFIRERLRSKYEEERAFLARQQPSIF